jgi:hypothetical protein
MLLALQGFAAEKPSRLQQVRSPQWGFCLAYPAEWKAAPLFGGDVTQLLPASQSKSGLQGEIRFGAFRNQKNSEPSNVPKSLEEIADDSLDNIKDQMVKQLSVENQSISIAGERGLITNISYDKDGVPWREKHARVRRADEVVIELQLIAPASQYSTLEPAFDRMVKHSLQPRCPSRP